MSTDYSADTIYLVICSSVSVARKNGVQIVLICVVVRRSDDPVDSDIADLSVSIIGCFISRIVVCDPALELLVPDLGKR